MSSYSRYFTSKDFENFKETSKRNILQNSTLQEKGNNTVREDVFENSSTTQKPDCVEMDSIMMAEQNNGDTDSSLDNSSQLLSYSLSNSSCRYAQNVSKDANNNLTKWCRCHVEQEEQERTFSEGIQDGSATAANEKLSLDVQALGREENVFKSEVKCESCNLEIRENQRRRKRIIELWMKFFGSSSSTESCDSYCSNV